ncbi:MAG: hypothetical protein HMLKMBBP_00231 [Planctomycetes bacterium]|nr:hypothetical protein [Planctomycetota bacterium]
MPAGLALRTLAAVALASGAAASLVASGGGGGRVGHDGPLFFAEQPGLRLEYHAISGRERMFDPRSGRPAGTPEDAARLRDRLLRRFDAASEEQLRAPWRASIEQISSLGYF